MVWRPMRFLIEGRLDNSQRDKVTGWMKFAGLKEKVTFDLEGSFHGGIHGAKICFTGDAYEDQQVDGAESCMAGFALHQTGKVGDITAGLSPGEHKHYPSLEWYSRKNGRVVIRLEPVQVELIEPPMLPIDTDIQLNLVGSLY